jgi:hypothetical protein
MKKYIFTESQIKKVVDVILNEQTILKEEHREILKPQVKPRTGIELDNLGKNKMK